MLSDQKLLSHELFCIFLRSFFHGFFLQYLSVRQDFQLHVPSFYGQARSFFDNFLKIRS